MKIAVFNKGQSALLRTQFEWRGIGPHESGITLSAAEYQLEARMNPVNKQEEHIKARALVAVEALNQ